ncbi:hypothetical protein GCM10010182_16790 [Actinomadura cremea]|nr:hypothetical protein GCM10010182_16790 [Actinomadura cremea]
MIILMLDFNISNHTRLAGARVVGQGAVARAGATPQDPRRRREPVRPGPGKARHTKRTVMYFRLGERIDPRRVQGGFVQETTEKAPTGPVTELADRHGLGAWTGYTAGTKKSLFSKKWADAHLYLYDQGVVVTGPDDHAAAYEWTTMRVLQHRMSVNGSLVEARYTLIAPDGAATAIGPGSHSLTGRDLDRLGVTSLTKGAPFLYPGDWGGAIQRGVTRAQLPGLVTRLREGESVEFGRLTADQRALSHNERTAAWSEIAEISTASGTGMASFVGTNRRDVLPPEHVHRIPNFDLLLNLWHDLKG